MSVRLNQLVLAIVFAALWMAGMLWRSSSIDLDTVAVSAIVGGAAGLLMYWVFDIFGGRLRG